MIVFLHSLQGLDDKGKHTVSNSVLDMYMQSSTLDVLQLNSGNRPVSKAVFLCLLLWAGR